MLQRVHVFEAQVFRKSLGSEFEITWDTQFSITHAAPPYVSLPAVSSSGAFRTPAPVRAAPPSWGRHPQTVIFADVVTSNATSRTQSYRRGSTRGRGHTGASAQRRSAIGRSQACSSEMSRLV
jgi:hypothetical protein